MERMQKELLEEVRGEIEKQKVEMRTMIANNSTPRAHNGLPSQTEVNPNAKINQVESTSLKRLGRWKILVKPKEKFVI